MNDVALSAVAVALLVISSSTGAAAASISVGDGASMEPALCDNSVVVLDREASAGVGDIVVAEYSNQRVTHRVVRLTSTNWEVGPDGTAVERPGYELVTSGDNSTGVDATQVIPAPQTDGGHVVEHADPEQVVGVVDRVLYDGCGPL
jgi:signal peptidase I